MGAKPKRNLHHPRRISPANRLNLKWLLRKPPLAFFGADRINSRGREFEELTDLLRIIFLGQTKRIDPPGLASGKRGTNIMRTLLRQSLALFLLLACAASSRATPATANDHSLDGVWSFIPDQAGTIKIGELPSGSTVRPINVPGSWQAQFPDMRDYTGVAWYWRSVRLDSTPAGQVVLLRFGAVDYAAEVYFNAQKVGTH